MKPYIYRAICGGTIGLWLDDPALEEWNEIMIGSFIAAGSPKWAHPWVTNALTRTGKAQVTMGKHALRAGGYVAKRQVAKKSVSRVAMRVGAKGAIRAVPYVGWALLAYDVYDLLHD